MTAEHITHFTKNTLIKLLNICGYSFIWEEKKNISRKYSIRLIFKKSEVIKNYEINLNEILISKKIFSKAIKLNTKRTENFKRISKK